MEDAKNKAAEVCKAQKLPPSENYPRLYELGGMSYVCREYSKQMNALRKQYSEEHIGAMILETKIENAQHQLLQILHKNNIYPALEDLISIVIDSSFCSAVPEIDNRIFHFD